MKVVVSVSALVFAAALAAPALAGDGYLDLNYGQIDSSSIDINRWQVGGAASTEIGSGGWNIQGDARHSRLHASGTTISAGEGAVHAFYRDDRFAAGGYASTGEFQVASFYGAGAEGKLFFDRATLSGAVGVNMIEIPGTTENGWDGSIGAKVFLTDNATLNAGAAYFEIENVDSTTWSLGGEFKPDTLPVSFFGEYAGHDLGSGFLFGSGDTDAFKIGVRWNFGGGTLKDRDRTGATMNTGSSFLNSVF